MNGFELAVAASAVLAGVIASIAGFGIGSVLTPILALELGTKLAVAAVSIPHVIGTAIRLWMLRGHIDRRIFLWFGLASAAGGLLGALLHARASNRALGVVLGALLVFVALSELSGLMQHIRLGRRAAWVAGGVSGMFGGLVGNQGGIRSAALLAFEGDKQTFVATATAVGLVVDAARMPVYLATEWAALQSLWPLITIAVVGVAAGTLAGRHVLAWVPEWVFRRLVAGLLFALGGWLIVHG